MKIVGKGPSFWSHHFVIITMFRYCNAFTYATRHSSRIIRWNGDILAQKSTHQSSSMSKPSATPSHHLSFATATNKDEQYTLRLNIPTPEDMEDVGGLLSVNSNKGDVILLDGDLGAGKTCFSRGFIRARTGRVDERVTSPTYLLSNTYFTNDTEEEEGAINIYHMDLYRLSDDNDDDLTPLDLENVYINGISLIEWPSRLKRKPVNRLDVTLTIDSTISAATAELSDSSEDDEENDDIEEESRDRCMKLVPHGDKWVERLKFLESEGYFEDLLM